jgi:uncharacterized membrane protein
VWEILILNLTQVHGTVYGNKYIIWLEDIMSLPLHKIVNVNIYNFIRKKEDCSTPSGQRRNQRGKEVASERYQAVRWRK